MSKKLCFGDFSEDVLNFIFENNDNMANAVKLPEFWPLQAQLWFARADAEFTAKSVTAEQKKYAHVIASLPVEVAARVSDEILSPHDTQPYTALRQRLLDTYTLDEYQRFCSLMDMPARPADRPTALLDAMFAFLPDDVSRDDPGWMFKNLFLRRLSAELRTLLMPHKAETVRQIAVRGDELWSGMREATTLSAHAVDAGEDQFVSPPPSCHGCAAPTPPVQQCCSVSDGRNSRQANICYYHAMFGVRANSCRKPCSWQQPPNQKNGRGRGRN